MRLAAGLAALTGVAGLTTAIGGEVTYDFTTDPASVLTISGNNDAPWVSSGGNPGGFLALTYSQNSQQAGLVFPNIDPGKIVTAFEFTADLRVGNAQGNGGRPADGFSVSFARDGDPVLVDGSSGFAGGPPENGSTTGIAVNFDTWSGNALPDGADLEGILVRVDNVTINRTAMPTRNGACDDTTSLQTGPYNEAYWTGGGDPRDPAAWAGLCWQPFSIVLTEDGKLDVTYKGRKILDRFQTTYFPSAGQIVLAGRTGGANENTHFDNIKLKTTAATVTEVPGAPGSLAAAQIGSRRVQLTWTAATVAGNPNAQIAYEVERNGVVIVPLLTALTYTDRGVAPGTAYTYKVRGKNIAGNTGPDATVSATTVADVAGFGFPLAEQWTGIGGTAIDAGTGDPHFADPPDRVRFVNGFSFGETTNFGDTWGDNHLTKISAVFTPSESGNYRFFIRSDDAGALFVNTAGAAIPDPFNFTPVAVETGCCAGFNDVAADGTLPEETSEFIPLTAGTRYGIAFFVKEGGGGDWGQVAVRKEGNTTPAGQLSPLRGGVLSGPVDAVGASVSITTQPVAQTVNANSPVTFTAAATGSSPYGADYGNAIAYQWYVDGKAVLGANSATYSIAVTPKALDGKKVAVGAAVAGASVLSDEVVLTVLDDTVPPTVTRVSGSASFDSVTVVFSEPVTDSALTVGNYTITGLTLSNPTRVNERTVRFTSSTQAENTTYPVTINGVRDNANLPSAYSGSFKSYQFKTGLAQFNIWNDKTGGFATFVDEGIKDTPPNETRILDRYFTGTGLFENYFGQIQGVFIPETTGNYAFYLAGDDHSELYLSTDANPANKKKIAEEPQWSDPQKWNVDGGANSNTRDPNGDGLFTHRSDLYPGTEWAGGNTITLTGGQRYYLEVLYKEGGGGDHGAATFTLAGAAVPANGSTALTGARIGWYVDPGTLPPLITTAPDHQTINAGETATFTVVADSAVPVTYQWYRNNKPLPGATSASLVIPNAGPINVGDYRVLVSNANGSVASNDNNSRLILKGAFVVEIEDFNHSGGQTIAAASTMPLASSLYQGKDGILGIDFNMIGESTADPAGNGNSYRHGWVDNGTPVPAETASNVDIITDGNGFRGDFTLTQNYKIGWGDTGEWYNFTRNFPTGNYAAVFIGSRDGRAVDQSTKALELVTGNIAAPDQTTTRLGEAVHDQTGGWSSNDHIPFLKPGSPSGSTNPADLATFPLGANTTVRLLLAVGDGDVDALLFYKLPDGGGGPVVGLTPIPGLPGAALTDAVVNTATKTITAKLPAAGTEGFITITPAVVITSVTLVGDVVTIRYQ